MNLPLKKLVPLPLKARLQFLKDYSWVMSLLGKINIIGSQAGQDYWVIYEAFNEKRNGFFVDVGAYDGVRMSNTLLLESRYHWKGICIEGNPEIFAQLSTNRKALCINQCVNGTEGEVAFKLQNGRSGIVPTNNTSRAQADVKKMLAIPLQDILRDCDSPKVIDYLSIDVEGFEESILGEFPFSDYVFKTMTIERPSDSLRNLLENHGYLLVKEIPNFDSFYIHKSFLKTYKSNLFEFYRSKHLKSAWR